MSLINIISVPTTNGMKTIEIHNGDITQLGFEVDILVLSAYRNRYFPAPNTVIKSLFDNSGIILEDLARTPELDLRSSLNCWLSQDINNEPFKKILCVEGIKTSIRNEGNSDSAIANLFGTIALLQYKKIEATSIALPILGSGFQGNSMEAILPNLIEKAIESLSSNAKLNSIYFVEIDDTKAQLIDETINAYLNRGTDQLEILLEDHMVAVILEKILAKLVQIRNNYSYYHNQTIKTLINKIKRKNIRFFELGILSRRLLELLLSDISSLERDKSITIFDHINDLKSRRVADWMITYLHALRVFGNFVAHEKESDEIPDHMEPTEAIVFSHALDRFLDFYIEMKNNALQKR